jgi:hypothetical protein
MGVKSRHGDGSSGDGGHAAARLTVSPDAAHGTGVQATARPCASACCSRLGRGVQARQETGRTTRALRQEALAILADIGAADAGDELPLAR